MSNEKVINAPIKILLLGSDTNVGQGFIAFASDLAEFVLTPLSQASFLEASTLDSHINQYDVVLDALSLNVESNDDYMAQISGFNQQVSESNIKMFMLSSVSVFTGNKGVAYEENELPDNEEKDAKQLANIESLVLADENGIVLRSGWLFGGEKNDFVANTLSSLKGDQNISLQDDFIGNPTPISDLVRVAFSLIKQRHYGAENTGVYHYACAEDISWFGFAEAISANAKQFNMPLQANLQPINEYQAESSELTLLRRQSLSCRKIFNHFGVKQRPWRASLRALVKDLYQMN